MIVVVYSANKHMYCLEVIKSMNAPKPIRWTPYLATSYAEGFGEGEGASEDQQLEAWQYLINSGLAWKLQGWFGRTAERLIESGQCIAKA